MKRLLGWAAILIAVAIGGVVGRGAGGFLWNQYERASFSERDVEKALLGQGELYRLLKLRFASDFNQLVAELTSLIKSDVPTSEIGTAAQAKTAKLRQHYAPFVAFVTDASLKRLIVSSRELHKSVLENQGARVCNDFGLRGAAAISGSASFYLDKITEQGVIYFEAIADAIDRPGIESAEASDSDWEALFVAMEREGVPTRYLDVLAEIETVVAQSPDDADVCPALMVFMNSLIAIPGDQGHRLRSAFVKGVAEK